MIELPDNFFDSPIAIHVTLEQFFDLIEQFSMSTIPIWDPPALISWAKQRGQEEGSFNVYWERLEKAVSCFGNNYWLMNDYIVYEYDDLIIDDPNTSKELSTILDLL